MIFISCFDVKYEQPKQLSPLVMAFIGDAVYGLLVPQRLVLKANQPVSALHKKSVHYVNASAQARGAGAIFPLLTEEEQTIYKRGRNAEVNSVPKNANVADYHKATGLEALFGFLYFSNNHERIAYLFDLIWDTIEAED